MIVPRTFRRLIQARQQAELPLTLTRRRIYILPTRAGLVFGFFLLAMLVAAVNYTNNLAFLLTFLLGSIGIISAIHAYANLAGVTLSHARILPAYCGDAALTQLTFQAGPRPRRSLEVSVGQAHAALSLPVDGGMELDLSVPTVRRGLFLLEKVRVSTRYPLGLFRAWSPLLLPVNGLAYARPLAAGPELWSRFHGSGDDQGLGAAAASGEFSGVRPYRPEDGLSRVSWKASARGAGLQTKEYRAGMARTVLLDWNSLAGFGYEERISLLTGLAREAEAGGLRYGLRLPGQALEPGSGRAHLHRCLEALALMPEES
jgi:uncharacterized protein (DUF58 family)